MYYYPEFVGHTGKKTNLICKSVKKWRPLIMYFILLTLLQEGGIKQSLT